MERRFSSRPSHRVFAVAALATLLRAGFVAWVPGTLSGDGWFYHYLSFPIAEGRGYLTFDGSPAIQWMPGWLATLRNVTSAGCSMRIRACEKSPEN